MTQLLPVAGRHQHLRPTRGIFARRDQDRFTTTAEVGRRLLAATLYRHVPPRLRALYAKQVVHGAIPPRWRSTATDGSRVVRDVNSAAPGRFTNAARHRRRGSAGTRASADLKHFRQTAEAALKLALDLSPLTSPGRACTACTGPETSTESLYGGQSFVRDIPAQDQQKGT